MKDDFKADATYSIWQDPSVYDYSVHGPPYLPPKTGSVKPTVKGMIRQAAVGKVGHFFKVVQSQVAPYADLPYGELAAVLVFLRALGVVHQSNHWATSGTTFYGDHLLFDRLYGDIVGESDLVAERAVGVGSPKLVDPLLLSAGVHEIVSKLVESLSETPTVDERVQASLEAEVKFLILMQIVSKHLKDKGLLSRGIDNLLAGIEDKHEEHVYLLKQRIG